MKLLKCMVNKSMKPKENFNAYKKILSIRTYGRFPAADVVFARQLGRSFRERNPRIPMQSYVSAMQPGWNLGNTFDSFNTNDPKKVTRRLGATRA